MATIIRRPGKPKEWDVRWRFRGVQRSKSFARKADAKVFRLGREVDEATGVSTWVDPRTAPAHRTVSIAAAAWLADREDDPELAESTVARDRSYVTSFIDGDGIGAVHIDRLRRGDVKDWIRRLQKRYAPGTVVKARQILSAVCNFEIDDDDGIIDANPVTRTKGPNPAPLRPRLPLSDQQMEAILDHLDGRYRAMAILSWSSGLRWGEVAGLRANRIDPAGFVTVDATLRRDGTLKEKPKSAASRATIPIAASVAAELETHLARYPVTGDGLVFRGAQGQPLRYSNWRRRVWVPAATAAGLTNPFGEPIVPTFHDTRRSTATNLFRAGVDVVKTKGIMRHAKIDTTVDVYTTVRPEDLTDAVLAAPGVGPVLADEAAETVAEFPEEPETVEG